MGAAAGASLVDVTRSTSESGPRQHAILAADPSLATVAQEVRHGFFYGGGADDAGIAHLNQDGSFSSGDVVGKDVDRPELIRGALVAAIDHKRGL